MFSFSMMYVSLITETVANEGITEGLKRAGII